MDDAERDELLVRVDERTKFIKLQMKSFVLKTEFDPVRKIVYGFTGATLLAVLAGILALVFKP